MHEKGVHFLNNRVVNFLGKLECNSAHCAKSFGNC